MKKPIPDIYKSLEELVKEVGNFPFAVISHIDNPEFISGDISIITAAEGYVREGDLAARVATDTQRYYFSNYNLGNTDKKSRKNYVVQGDKFKLLKLKNGIPSTLPQGSYEFLTEFNDVDIEFLLNTISCYWEHNKEISIKEEKND